MKRTGWKMTTLALAFSGYASVTGCNSRDGSKSPVVEGQDTSGGIQVALTLAGGGTINTASYSITGPNSFTKTGTIPLQNS